MPDMSSAELALQKGEVDLIKGPREQAWGEKVEKISGVVVDSIGNPETFVAHFNMSVKPLDLLKVRQAMAHAVNQKEFVAVYGEKVAEPIYSAVPVGRMISGMTKEECAEENVLYEFNLGKAKELLVEAGYPDGFSLNVFTSESSVYKRAYELLQAQLRKIGVDVKLSVVDHSTFHARIRQNLNPIVVYVCTRPNPDIILTQFYHSGSIVVKGRKPITNFSHLGEVDADGDGAIDSIDDLIEAARIELDSARQVKLWKEAQKKILKYAAAVPIINAGYLYARHRYVDYGYEHVTVADGVKPTENTRILEKK